MWNALSHFVACFIAKETCFLSSSVCRAFFAIPSQEIHCRKALFAEERGPGLAGDDFGLRLLGTRRKEAGSCGVELKECDFSLDFIPIFENEVLVLELNFSPPLREESQ
jgi:hypothetical protein